MGAGAAAAGGGAGHGARMGVMLLHPRRSPPPHPASLTSIPTPTPAVAGTLGAAMPAPTLPPLRVETHPTLPSTQDEMRRRLEAGERVDGLVLRALEQTAGRGQRRRDWRGAAGGSYQTVALRDLPERRLCRPQAAVAVAVGVARALRAHGFRAQVKWPNDLVYRDKKLAGILCECVRGHLLVGVGMNVANPPPVNATALVGVDPEEAGDLVLEGVRAGLELLAAPTGLVAAFAAVDALAGAEVEVTLDGRTLRGRAEGITPGGALRLRTASGVVALRGGRAGRGPLRRAAPH